MSSLDLDKVLGQIAATGGRRTGDGFDQPWGPILGETIPAMTIPAIAVFLRLWARWVLPSKGPRFWWDDWFALATMPFTIATSVTAIYWVSIGLGQHIWVIKPENYDTNFKLLYAQTFLWNGGITFSKFSVLLFYARIFPATNKGFRIALWVTGIMNGAWELAGFLSGVFQCTPIRKAWRPLDLSIDGHCLDYYQWFLGFASSNLVIDLVVFLLPMPQLYQLKLPWHRKLLVLGVFTCGGASLACAVIRQVMLVNLGPDFIYDPMYNIMGIGKVVMVETPICILSVCMPVIFALFKHMVKNGPRSVLYSKNSNRNKSHSGASGSSGEKVRATKPSVPVRNPLSTIDIEEELMELQPTRSGYPRSGTSIQKQDSYPDDEIEWSHESELPSAFRPSGSITMKSGVAICTDHTSRSSSTAATDIGSSRTWYGEKAPTSMA